jgi:hypothetical protein
MDTLKPAAQEGALITGTKDGSLRVPPDAAAQTPHILGMTARDGNVEGIEVAVGDEDVVPEGSLGTRL